MPRLSSPRASSFIALLYLLGSSHRASAQAAPAASGPGSFLSFGVGASSLRQATGQQYTPGATAYVEANLFPRIGFAFEFRHLAADTRNPGQQNLKLGGIRLTGPNIHNARNIFRPYLVLFAAPGHILPGAGLDVHLAESRITIRLAELDYQLMPTPAPGDSHVFGLTTGVAVDLFAPRTRPEGRRF